MMTTPPRTRDFMLTNDLLLRIDSLIESLETLRLEVSEAHGRARCEEPLIPSDVTALLDTMGLISDEAAQAVVSVVHLARYAGVPWNGVGAALGVTKQAAQQRYGGAA